MVWPFKWNPFGSTFAWYHLFFNILQNEIWFFCWILMFGTPGSQRVYHPIDSKIPWLSLELLNSFFRACWTLWFSMPDKILKWDRCTLQRNANTVESYKEEIHSYGSFCDVSQMIFENSIFHVLSLDTFYSESLSLVNAENIALVRLMVSKFLSTRVQNYPLCFLIC